MATPSGLPVRLIKRSLLDTRWASRPSLSRSLTTVQHSLNTDALPEPLLRSRAHPIPERDLPTTQKPAAFPSKRHRGPKPAPPTPLAVPRMPPLQPSAPHVDSSLHPSIQQLLPLLKAQAPHYLRAHIHGKPYLITTGDIIRLPFLMHGVLPGDTLRLNRATLLGSRDYTLKPGTSSLLPSHTQNTTFDGRKAKEMGYLDERLFSCRARVLGTELEPLRIKEKTKRRQRHVKRVRSKHAYTVLRVMEIAVSDVENLPDVAPEAVGQGLSEVGQMLVNDEVGSIEELVEETAKTTPSQGQGDVGQIMVNDEAGKIEELVEETAKITV